MGVDFEIKGLRGTDREIINKVSKFMKKLPQVMSSAGYTFYGWEIYDWGRRVYFHPEHKGDKRALRLDAPSAYYNRAKVFASKLRKYMRANYVYDPQTDERFM